MSKPIEQSCPADPSYSLLAERLKVNDRLALISLIEEGVRFGSSETPIVADLFNDLWQLVSATVSGSKINRLKAEDSPNSFHVFEITGESGEDLGRLNMLYLKKPLPCYYLVYVEVAAPYRRKGLGNRILSYFKKFLMEKSALGILDNVIPKDDPTFHIYKQHDWLPIEDIIGNLLLGPEDNYMIYVPPNMAGRSLKEPLMKLIYHLKRKRPVIDMRENEVMVQRTIGEFKDLYRVLLIFFEKDLRVGAPYPPLMRFTFTRFVTKLIGFRRRIADLLGYTGGESMEQIALDPEIAAIPVQSYAPKALASQPAFVSGDQTLWLRLPEGLKRHPARWIEALENYRRPSLLSWLTARGLPPSHTFTLGDLMDLGFDPTRLKEFIEGEEAFIFERIQVRQMADLHKKKSYLEQVAAKLAGTKVKNARLLVNPPLLTIRDRGNAYVLRHKIGGIHWEEAVEQLQSAPALQTLNRSLGLDRLVTATVSRADSLINERVEPGDRPESLAFFTSWNLKTNQPRLTIDFTQTFIDALWVA